MKESKTCPCASKYWIIFVMVAIMGCHDSHWEFNDRYLYENGTIAEIDSINSALHYLVTERVLNFSEDDHYPKYEQKLSPSDFQ